MNPFFSILVPAYNMSGKMQECIDSLLAQTMQDFEVICVDDGSTDDTYKCLLELADADKRFSVFRHDENRSLLAARYTAMEHARGDYVLFLDSDDWLTSDALEELSGFLTSNPVDIVRFGTIWEPDGREVMPPVSEDPLLDFMEGKIPPAIWKNAYKLDVIKKLLSRTAPFYCNLGEDVFLSGCLFSLAESVERLEKILHHYLLGGMSTNKSGSCEKIRIDMKSATASGEHLLSFIEKYNPTYLEPTRKEVRTMKRFVLTQNTMFESDYVKIVERLSVFDTEENRSIYEWGCRSFLPYIVTTIINEDMSMDEKGRLYMKSILED